MTNHSPCIVSNKDFGPWEPYRRGYPWDLFYRYYRLTSGSNVYYDRRNRLDTFFDRLCRTFRKTPPKGCSAD